MRTVFWALLGAAGGFALGVAVPVALSLLAAWREGFAPGSGAGTAFSILMIVTAPGGALAGLVAGALYGYYE